MYKDYSGQNLRGRSFKGQNLEGADFSRADIRSTDFTGAYLKGANFRGAKAGLQKRWVMLLLGISWLLAGICGFLSASAGLMLDLRFLIYLENQVAAWVFLIVIIALIAIIIRQGINPTKAAAFTLAGVGAFAGVGAVALLFGNFINGVFAIGAFTIASSVTFVFAGAFAGAVPITIRVVVSGAFTFACVGAFTGVSTIVASTTYLAKAFTIGLAFTGVGALLLFLPSVYIVRQAIKGSEKYATLRSAAIAFAAFGGTSFRGTNLTDTNFNGAILKSSDFRGANLTRTCFQETKKLDRVRAGSTYLEKLKLVKVLVTKQGQNSNFDRQDLRGVNFQGVYLQDASLIGADLSKANLQDADLSRAKLVQTQLDGTDFTGATLTGAYVEDWNITSNTNFTGVRCEYVYMRQPTLDNPDPHRKPDNREEVFGDGEFGDFIQPIFNTLDLYHSQGVDPRAIAISFKQLAENNPDAELEIVAMEKRGSNNFLLRTKTVPNTDKSVLSAEYFDTYNQIKALPEQDIKLLLAEKDSQINRLENMVMTALERPSFYAKTYNNQGDTMPESKRVFNFDQKGAQIGGIADTINAHQIGGNINNNSQQPETEKTGAKTILILAANPKGTSTLRLDEEVREIDLGLQRAKKRELFNLEQRWAVRVQDVYQALLDYKPQIVHFSGHGAGDDGLILEDETGNLQLVNTEALVNLFKLFSGIECIVLNACYSEAQATAIVEYVPYVVGMNKEIGDIAAIKFATGFYNALGAGESVEFAYKLGCNVIQLEGIPEHLAPVLLRK